MMTEKELAAVEEDVERKRVAKNPFEKKFTTLTQSSFAATNPGDGQEMETLSRQIIVRMEVIAKQIAFLSKETAGQPDKMLSGPETAVKSPSAGNQPQDVSALLGSETVSPRGRNASSAGASNSVDGERISSTTPHEGGVNGSGRTTLGVLLSARLDIYRRIRQGRATATDLFPATILSHTLPQNSVTAERGVHPLGEAIGDFVPSIDSSSAAPGPSLETSPESENNGGDTCDTYARPGVLHQFIKHVRPFSLCFDSSAGSSRLESPQTSAAMLSHLEDDATAEAGFGAEGSSRRGTDTAESDFPCRAPTGSNTLETGSGKTGNAGHYLSHRTPSRPRPSSSAEEDGGHESSGGEGAGRKGGCGLYAPRKPSVPVGAPEALRRAKARLQGKRKLGYSSPTSAKDKPENSTASGTARRNHGPMGGATWSTRRQTKEARPRGSSGKNAQPSAGRLLLSWKSAKDLRQRMESAAACQRRPRAGTSGKKAGRGGRKAGANQINLSDSIAGASSVVGSLSLVHANSHFEFPEIKEVNDYLVSLANPERDLAAMTRAFRGQPRPVPAPPGGSLESPVGSPVQLDESLDSFTVELDEIGRDDGQSRPHDKKDEARENTRESKVVFPVSQTNARTAVQDTKPGSTTCVIDLRNIWQRTGAVSHTISQAVKDSEKRSSLANTLRDTLTRLDTQHRQKAREQQVTCCVDSDDGQDGARVPETSISVSLRDQTLGPNNATSPSKAVAADGAARMFALVVSLAHVHNISARTSTVPSDNRDNAAHDREVEAPSQLKVELGRSGKEAVVIARGK